MNEVTNITQKILDDARAFAKQCEDEARAKADSLLEEGQLEAKHAADDILAGARAEAENILSRAQSQAGLDARNDRLSARRTAIAGAFQRAGALLCALPQEQYVELLARMVIRYQTKDAVLILNQKDKETIGPALLKRVAELSILEPGSQQAASFTEAFLSLIKRVANRAQLSLKIADETGSFQGGFILVEGSIDTNCTVEVLVEGMQHDLEGEVIQTLFN